MTHEHRAAPGLTSHPNKPPGCSQYLPVSLSPSPLRQACWASPQAAQLGGRVYNSSPIRTLSLPNVELISKVIKQMASSGHHSYGNGHANSGTVSQGGDSIWSRMELLKTCVLIQCFSSAFSPLAWCFSASAGLQGKLSKKGRAWLLTRQLETSGHVYSGLIHREVNWSLPLHSLHEAHRGLQGVFYPGHKQ